MRKSLTFFTLPDLAGFALATVIFIYGVHQSQLLPHHLVEKIAGTTVMDCMITNPVQVHAVGVQVPTPTGMKTEIRFVTNQLWTVWKFR